MRTDEQRDLFLVLTAIGIFASFVVIVGGVVVTLGAGDEITREIKAGNTAAALGRLRVFWPASIIASVVLLGTLFSYRRCRKPRTRSSP